MLIDPQSTLFIYIILKIFQNLFIYESSRSIPKDYWIGPAFLEKVE